jgi:LTXXQ motif family protein
MKKVCAVPAIAAFALILFASLPARAFGLHIGPFHLGVPGFGHRHHHHSLYMHGNGNDVVRRDSHETSLGAPHHGVMSPALLYPARALPPIFQNVFWPAFSSPWPFSYDAIFTTSFAAPAADRNRDECRQAFDANAIVERLRATIGPNAEQMERLQRLGGALAAAADYLAKSCPTEVPPEPTARLQLMDSQIQVLTMAVDIIHQPLQDFEQSLTDEQRAKLAGEVTGKRTHSARKHRIAARTGSASLGACGTSPAAIDWSIGEIDKSVQPNAQQREALADVQQAFGRAANDLQAHCPSSVPRSAVARLEAIESRLDATWRAILSIQVALQDFENKLSDDQKTRLQAMTFAAR